MNLLKKYLLSTGLILLAYTATNSAQTGTPYITNFSVQRPFDYNNFDITQDAQGMMLFANRKGVLVFDGIEWFITRTPDVPYVFFPSAEKSIIYTGCFQDFGYLKRNDKGLYAYHSISGSYYKPGLVFFIDTLGKDVVFVDEYAIVKVSKDNNTIQQIIPVGNTETLIGAFLIKNTLYVYSDNMTLYQLKADRMVQVSSELFRDAAGSIRFSKALDARTCLLANTNNRLFLFSGKGTKPFNVQDQSYLNLNTVTSAKKLTDSSFVVSTLTGGCVVINKWTGKTIAILNYSTGLPDNEIMAIGTDKVQGLWISHAMGISRIDLALPLRTMSNYPGLKGNLLSVLNADGMLYVTTSEGVFYGVASQSQNTMVTATPSVVRKSAPVAKSVQSTPPAKQDDTSKRRGVFSRMFQKGSPENSSGDNSSADLMALILKSSRENAAKREIRNDQVNTSFSFKQISGIQNKCKQIIQFKNLILVSGTQGIYSIVDKKAVSILSNAYVNFMLPSIYYRDILYVCTSDGILAMKYADGRWTVDPLLKDPKAECFSIYEMNKEVLLAGGYGKVYKIISKHGRVRETKTIPLVQDFPEKVIVRNIKGEYFFLSSTAMLKYDTAKDSAMVVDSLKKIKPACVYSHGYITWLKIADKWQLYAGDQSREHPALSYLNIFENTEDIFLDDKQNVWVIDNHNNLYRISRAKGTLYTPAISLYIKGIRSPEGTYLTMEHLELDYSLNAMQILIRAPFYLEPTKIQYQFYIEGKMNKWSAWSSNPVIDFPFLTPGEYEIHIRAKSILGKVSTEKIIEFYVKPPFWETWWFYTLLALVAIGGFIVIMREYEKKLIRDKRMLEEKIRERTRTIEEQRDFIAKQNEDIRNSILYAKRIQTAVLPSEEQVKKTLPEHFILFKPRDIVSGDFYWTMQRDNKTIIVAADCTGHGVSGAFMSMLGVAFLNEIVNRSHLDSASDILNELRQYVKTTLSQTGRIDEAKDGMDLVLCIYDHKAMKIHYAGAFNSLILIHDNQLQEYKGDPMPIGIHMLEEKNFTNHVIDVKKGDVLYMYSDGYQDQMGGELKRKFMSKPFKRLLLNIHAKPLKEQHSILIDNYEQWKMGFKQTDDILVMGIRL